ncbi:hypothetical protein [Sporichthya sp.]|uniref:hypothetical protein n=1 Tax=Sporichthya sp. TaxID=65475 RepID=UPI001793607C|nr:hypothetical protein [Sporichthya sp.]MBA3741998.1 hypothetical protein [Sporichthya sp.]
MNTRPNRLILSGYGRAEPEPGGVRPGHVRLRQACGRVRQWSFGPNDYTSTDDAREFYFDPKALSPFNNRPGRCVPVNGGKRYIGATWPPKVNMPIPPAVAP